MKNLKLKENLYWVGIEDFKLRTFDIVMQTEYGTSYNSYVLKGSEKTALVETAKAKFLDEYLEKVESVTEIQKIDYIIMNHTEPDHSGSLEKLLEINPDITVVATATALKFLRQIVNHDFKNRAVQEGDTLSLGNMTLKFMILPFLHWPDTMYTYVPEIKTLFTCDSFGSHYATEEVLRSKVTDEEAYRSAAKYYFDNIIGPFKNPYMVNALKKTEGLDVDMICPGHGPVLDSHIEELRGWYTEWCSVPRHAEKQVVMAYVTSYGYTASLAQAIAKGVQSCGGIEVKVHDMTVEKDLGPVRAEIQDANGVLFGTPTIVGEALGPIWALTTSMVAATSKGKLAAAFGDYGWSGEAVPHITERLKQLRINVMDGFRVQFKPTEEDLKNAEEFGKKFGMTLLGKAEQK